MLERALHGYGAQAGNSRRDQRVQRLEELGQLASVEPQESTPSRAFFAIRSPKRCMYGLSGAV